MKVCNVIPSGEGKFNCFLLDSRPGRFPSIVDYDLKEVCPRLDRYWHHEHKQKAEALARQDTMEVVSERDPDYV